MSQLFLGKDSRTGHFWEGMSLQVGGNRTGQTWSDGADGVFFLRCATKALRDDEPSGSLLSVRKI